MADFFTTATSAPSGAFNTGAASAAQAYPQMTYSQLMQLFSGLGNTVGAENTRQFDVQYELNKSTIDNNYRVAMMNARTQADQQRAQQQYNEAQIQLATQRLEWDREQGRAQLGQNLMQTAASLRGPANYYQSAEYMRGVSQMPETSTFLTALQNNARLADFGAQGGLSEPETLSTLANKLQGGTGLQNGAPSEDATLAQIGNIAAKGAHQLGAGALENLTSTEQKLFTSGLDELGIDTSSFLDQYARSRIGQSVGSRRAA